MSGWSFRHVFMLMLGLSVALGMGLSAVQASDMMLKMSMASDMGASGHDDCNRCSGSSTRDDGAKVMVCPPACVASVAAVLPHTGSATVALVVMNRPPPKDVLLFGRASPPDPYPPRSVDLV